MPARLERHAIGAVQRRQDDPSDLGDIGRVRVGGELPVIAEVTEAAVQELGLDDGGDVWVAIKATEIRVAPV